MVYIDFEVEVSGNNSDEELIFPEKLTNDGFIDNIVQEEGA